jgi:outer membrane protein
VKLLQGMTLGGLVVVCLGLTLIGSELSLAQSSVKPPDSPLTLDQAVDFALANYPAIRASMERSLASKEGVSLSRTAYLPRTDLLWQSNRATRNNIFGLLLPQSVVPPISGPVLPSTSDQGVWGSAAGILVSWAPFDFGYRGANVDPMEEWTRRRWKATSSTTTSTTFFTSQAFNRLSRSRSKMLAC